AKGRYCRPPGLQSPATLAPPIFMLRVGSRSWRLAYPPTAAKRAGLPHLDRPIQRIDRFDEFLCQPSRPSLLKRLRRRPVRPDLILPPRGRDPRLYLVAHRAICREKRSHIMKAIRAGDAPDREIGRLDRFEVRELVGPPALALIRDPPALLRAALGKRLDHPPHLAAEARFDLRRQPRRSSRVVAALIFETVVQE